MPNQFRAGFMLLAVMTLTVMPAISSGQQIPEIPRNILQGEQLSSSDRDMVVRMYIQPRVRTLQNAATNANAAREITSLRSDLTVPLRANVSTPAFRREYDKMLASQLNPLVSSEHSLIRMNAMIILAGLESEAGQAHLLKGLQDSSDAVKYWAARTTAEILERKRRAAADAARRANAPQIDPRNEYDYDQQRRLVAAIVAGAKADTHADTVEQLYRALGEMSVDEAIPAIVRLTTMRADRQLENGISEGLRVDQAGLRSAINIVSRLRERFRASEFRRLFSQLGPDRAGQQAFLNARDRFLPHITDISRVNGRLAILAATVIANPDSSAQLKLEAHSILDQALLNYRTLLSFLNQAPETVPGDFAAEARQNNLSLMNLYISDWITAMPESVGAEYMKRLTGE